MTIKLLDKLESPWSVQGSGWEVAALSLDQVAQTPGYVSEGYMKQGSDREEYKVLSIESEGGEGVVDAYAERNFDPAENLSEYQDIRFWLRCDPIGVAHSEDHPLFLQFEVQNKDGSPTWRRLLPVKQSNVWEPHCLWLGDMDKDLQKGITQLRLSSRDPKLSFHATMGDLVATAPEPINDAHQNLLDRLKSATQKVIPDKKPGEFVVVKVFTELPEAKQAKSQMPSVVVTFWSIKPMRERGGSVDLIDNYVPPEYELNLMSLDSADALPTQGKSLVLVARIEDFYHARIFDWTGKKVIDKGKDEFLPNEMLIQQLEEALRSQSIDDQIKSELIQKITSALDYTPAHGAHVRPVPWLTQLDFAIDVYAQTPIQKNQLLAAIVDNFNRQPYLRINAMPLSLLPFTPSPEETASLVSPGRSPLFYRVTVPIERGDRQFYPYPDLAFSVNLKYKKQGSFFRETKDPESVTVT